MNLKGSVMSEYSSLENYNTYRIKSFAKYVYFPKNEEEILEAVAKHEKIFFIGNGSNIILSKECYDDDNIGFVILCKNFNSFSINDETVEVDSGMLLPDLALCTYKAGLSGIETFYDVPASVGGALIMNAGAYGDEIYTYVKSVRVLDIEAKKIIEHDVKDIDFSYRYSMFKNDSNICILSAKFKFEKKPLSDIKAKLDDIYSRRLINLPQQPTGGSVFKRPQADARVGAMVEDLGMKGLSVGDAQISRKHAGIIVNNGDAKGSDIIALIEHVKKEVFANYNINLHEEQIII